MNHFCQFCKQEIIRPYYHFYFCIPCQVGYSLQKSHGEWLDKIKVNCLYTIIKSTVYFVTDYGMIYSQEYDKKLISEYDIKTIIDENTEVWELIGQMPEGFFNSLTPININNKLQTFLLLK